MLHRKHEMLSEKVNEQKHFPNVVLMLASGVDVEQH